MNMGNITIKTYLIGMAVEFESSVIHLYNCLTKVISTHGILSAEKELEVKVNNQERQISTLRWKDSITVGKHPMEQHKKRANKY